MVLAVRVLHRGDDVRVTFDSLGGEGGVRRGDVNGVRRGRSQDVLHELPFLIGLQSSRVLGIAGTVGDLSRRLRIDLVGQVLVELEVGCVERLLRGLGQAGRLQGDVLEVLELVPLNGHRRGSRVGALQSPPVLQGGHQCEGLERGAGLSDGIGRRIDLAGQIVLPAVERQKAPRRGIDGHQRLAQVRRGPSESLLVLHDACGSNLILVVDRGDDLEATGVDLLG